MNRKIRVGIIFGGKSPEHEVSLLSAKNVIEAIDKEKFEVVLIGIDKEGEWHLKEPHSYLSHANDPKLVCLGGNKECLSIIPTDTADQILKVDSKQAIEKLDVVFPVLHGINGEDGTMQGLLQLAGIPYVGCGVLSTAVCMDKDVSKRLLKEAGIPVAKFLTFRKRDKGQISFEKVKEQLGLPFFIKPANNGSSVGISKVKEESAFKQAIEEAFAHDQKILIEEYIEGREIECAVLGNEFPIASLPGEVIPTHDFYSYEAKYIDPNGAILHAPAPLTEEEMKAVRKMAVDAYVSLECEGMARVDIFMKKDGSLYINEVNTLPGFTNISMYPRLWQVTGLSYPELIEKLLYLALEKAQRSKEIKTSFDGVKKIILEESLIPKSAKNEEVVLP